MFHFQLRLVVHFTVLYVVCALLSGDDYPSVGTIELTETELKALFNEEKWEEVTPDVSSTLTTSSSDLTVCPGDKHPYLPACKNVRGPLVQVKFTNSSYCIFTKPDEFPLDIAVMKTIAFCAMALFGISMNAWIVIGGYLKRGNTRNFLIGLVSLGDLINLIVHVAVDAATFDKSYQYWRLGETACVLGSVISPGATAFSQVSLMFLFIERYSESASATRVIRAIGEMGIVFFVVTVLSLLRMVALGTGMQYEECVLRDGTVFNMCQFNLSNDLVRLMTTYIMDITVFHFLIGVVIVYATKKTLPGLEMKASLFKSQHDIFNAKFLHMLIIVAMLTLTLTSSSRLLHIFVDLSQYDIAPSIHIIIRGLMYINCALVKPVLYLLFYREILPTKKQVCNQSRILEVNSQRLPELNIPPLDENASTEEIIESIRELRRQTSMTPVKGQQQQQQPVNMSGINRSRSFDSSLNSRVHFGTPAKGRITNPVTPKTGNTTPTVAHTPKACNTTPKVAHTPRACNTTGRRGKTESRYINLDDAVNAVKWQKQKSDSNILRPKSLYMNLSTARKPENQSTSPLGFHSIDQDEGLPQSPTYIETQNSVESGYCSSFTRQMSEGSDYCSLSPDAEIADSAILADTNC